MSSGPPLKKLKQTQCDDDDNAASVLKIELVCVCTVFM